MMTAQVEYRATPAASRVNQFLNGTVTFLLVLPAILSFLVLAAHFLREWNFVLVGLSLLMPLLLLIKTRYTLRAMQLLMMLAAAEWGFTAMGVVRERIALHEPFLRAGAIFAGVGGFCVLAAALSQTRRLKRCYSAEAGESGALEAVSKR